MSRALDKFYAKHPHVELCIAVLVAGGVRASPCTVLIKMFRLWGFKQAGAVMSTGYCAFDIGCGFAG